ncbi:hypothetical protein [Mesorhizobium sp. WSM2239]|uniref:Uncharacterized protein n=2 Tax=unclassified Mesorhizobium TaxID=325217 RepID=A0AAU8DH43_9HYPH
MFIDERSVDRLFGAIVQPEYILLHSSETAQKGHTEARGDEAEGSGEVSLPAFFKLGTKAKITGNITDATSHTAQITKQFVYSSEQRLQDVVVAYKEMYPERVLFSKAAQPTLTSLAGTSMDWMKAEALLDEPGVRPLLFIDLEPRVEILPMAGETGDGKTILIFESMIERLKKDGIAIPDFPDDRAADAEVQKECYWDALVRSYSNRVALESIENAFKNGQRIDWIDYRLKLATRAIPVHLHFAPAGRFPTGVFAYNLVRRGYKVGLRIVGQLKKGCDINVLALYER